MSDVVKFGADATQYFDTIARMRSSLSSLQGGLNTGGAGGGATGGFFSPDFGEGFLKGERRVSSQAKFLVAQMLQTGDASSIAAAAMQAFLLSTQVGLGATVVGVAFFEGFKLLHDNAVKTEKDFQALRDELGKPLGAEIHQSAGEIASDLTAIDAKTAELFKDTQSNATKFGKGQFADIFSFAFPKLFPSEGPTKEDTAVVEGLERERALTEAVGDAALKTADIKDIAVHQSEEVAAAAKIELDAQQKIAKSIVDAGEQRAKILGEFGVKPQDEDSLKGFKGTDEQKAKVLQLLQETYATQQKITVATREGAAADTDALEKKAALAKAATTDATTVANFRGPDVERQTLSVNLALKRALAEKQIADSLGQQEGIATANQHVAEAGLSVLQNQIKLAERALEIRASQGQTAVLSAEAAHDDEAVGLLKIRLDYEQKIAAAVLQQKDPKIISNLRDQAALAKQIFEDNLNFKRQQDLEQASGANQVSVLKAVGDKFGADILAERLKVEQQITGEIRNQNGALATQHELGGETDIIAKAAAEKTRLQNLTPQQQAAEQQKTFQEQTQFNTTQDRIDRFLAAQDAAAKGANPLDLGGIPDLTPTEQKAADQIRALRDAQNAAQTQADAAKADEVPVEGGGVSDLANADFSQLIELGQADFSGLVSIGQADFSGLLALDGLDITVQ
jgi:hypothetical protein